MPVRPENIPKTHALRQAASYRKFNRDQLCVLLLDGRYHLHGECSRSLTRLGHRVVSVAVENNAAATVKRVLWAIVEHRPDFILSINHLGFDEGGMLGEILAQLQVPIAVWYVDSPVFVLGRFSFPAPQLSTVFLWERAYKRWVCRAGAEDVHYLPLAAEPAAFIRKFIHGESLGYTEPVRSLRPITFVGDSMNKALRKWKKKVASRDRDCVKRLAKRLDPAQRPASMLFDIRATAPRDINILAAATWEATARYRLAVLRNIPVQALTLYGDEGWKTRLPQARYRGALAYGRALAEVYATSQINLNMTSLQMPTAVNQRVFDVPLAGGFVLSDDQEDLHRHFKIGEEAVVFSDPGEIPGILAYYLAHEDSRQRIVHRARQRILSEHTYCHRLKTMIEILRQRWC